MVSKYNGVPFGVMNGGSGESKRPFCGFFVNPETIVEYFEFMAAAKAQYRLFVGISISCVASFTINSASVIKAPEIVTLFAFLACL